MTIPLIIQVIDNGTGSPPVKKPPFISRFYTDEKNVANKKSKGQKEATSKYNFSLFFSNRNPSPQSLLNLEITAHSTTPLATDSENPSKWCQSC